MTGKLRRTKKVIFTSTYPLMLYSPASEGMLLLRDEKVKSRMKI